MAYRWKPSKAQRREFAQNMQDENFAAAYNKRKEEKYEKRRENSKFDYATAGGSFVPTEAQYNFCMNSMDYFEDGMETNAANMVISGFTCNEKVHHDFIHVVNEVMRRSA